MNRTQRAMEQMVALVLLAFSLGLICGEIARDARFGDPAAPEARSVPSPAQRKWQHYSGCFLLLQDAAAFPATRWRQLLAQALAVFRQLVLPHPAPP